MDLNNTDDEKIVTDDHVSFAGDDQSLLIGVIIM